jgi:type VI secretion system protein ImpB
MTPGLNLRVENTLKEDGSEIGVQLRFDAIEDFDPGNIVKQVPALKRLLEARDKLRDLQTKADRSENLERLLERVLQNTEDMKKLHSQVVPTDAGADAAKGDK